MIFDQNSLSDTKIFNKTFKLLSETTSIPLTCIWGPTLLADWFVGFKRYSKLASNYSKNKMVRENAVTRAHRSCALRFMGSWFKPTCTLEHVDNQPSLFVGWLKVPYKYRPLGRMKGPFTVWWNITMGNSTVTIQTYVSYWFQTSSHFTHHSLCFSREF